MKKLILGSLLVLLTQPVFAAKYRKIKAPTNPALKEAYVAVDAEESLYTRVVKITAPTKDKRGRSEEEIRTATVAQITHGVCGFFDEGVKLKLEPNTAQGAKHAVGVLEDQNQFTDQARSKALIDGLTQAVTEDPEVEVYSGSAGGNNTMGTVLGVYDIKNKEILVLSFTNCGSDD